MELTVKRRYFTDKSTIGELEIDGSLFCFTLEDIVRDGPKVSGETAIPEGRYEVCIDFSNRFQRMMPHILNVPGFDGIRIHSGNTAADTEGCIILGQTREKDLVGMSRVAFKNFFDRLESALKNETCYVTIVNGPMLKEVDNAN